MPSAAQSGCIAGHWVWNTSLSQSYASNGMPKRPSSCLGCWHKEGRTIKPSTFEVSTFAPHNALMQPMQPLTPAPWQMTRVNDAAEEHGIQVCQSWEKNQAEQGVGWRPSLLGCEQSSKGLFSFKDLQKGIHESSPKV